METKEYTTDQEQLARFAKAMGHPARIAILNFLAQQNCCFFGDIHEVLPISKATVSQHLKEFDGTLIVVSHDRDFLTGLVHKVYEFGNKKVKEHLEDIQGFLRKKKMENLREIERKS